MQRSYPWLALGLGLLLTLLLMRFGPTPDGGGLPLLTALLISEFGFLLTLIAAGISLRDLVRDGAQAVCLLLLALLLMRFGPTPDGGGLPLLTALLISEFGFLLTLIAAGIGLRDLLRDGVQAVCLLLLAGNALLALNFLRTGLALWPGAGGG